MLLGADGFIPSIAPLFPELFVKFYEKGKSGDIAGTMELNELIAETSSILGMSKNATASNKFALSRLGYTQKRIIAPQDPVTMEDEGNIIRKINEINDKCRKRGII